MAKAPKVSQTVAPSFKDDATLIAEAFAATATIANNDAARAAILRRVNDGETFNKIRLQSLAAWGVAYSTKAVARGGLVTTKNGQATPRVLTPAIALAIWDKSTQGMNTTIGNKPKRDMFTQHMYDIGLAAWSEFLVNNAIETKTSGKSRKGPRAPRTPMGANIPDVNIVTPEAFVVARVKGMSAVIAEAHKAEAILLKIVNANSKEIKGDAGGRLRALAEYLTKELKAIEALDA